MTPSRFAVLGVVVLALIMLGSALAVPAAPSVSSGPSNPGPAAAAATSPAPNLAASGGSVARALGTNPALAATVAGDEQSLLASGHNPTLIHPPNLHQAPPLRSTGGSVTPLYSIAPAPMGVAYYGLSNTTGTIHNATLNTTSLAGSFSTGDPLGTQTEEFDVSTGSSFNDIQPARDSYGAQLNAVITNVSIFGHTSFYNPSDPDAPQGCPGYAGNPTTGRAPCPNEFWMQNYIEYQPANHELQIGNEIWNFSNPTASWGNPYNSSSTVDEQSLVGFGSVQYGLYYLTNTASEYGPTINIAYPFTLVLYINTTRGPCHTDKVPGTGVPTCHVDGSTVSMTEPVNEIFFNYSVWKTSSQPCPTGDICHGNHVCPATEPYPGIVCGEYDDIFFNSVNPATPHKGVPLHGPHGQIGSAAIEANGSAYDPVGLTNDFEFDYGIGSDDGDTNNVVYANGTVGINYCPQAHTQLSGKCSQYSETPAASDFGGETGETCIGEVDYWAPQASSGGAGLLTGAGAPLAHQVRGPSLLLGLWNMSGTGSPGVSGGQPLSIAHISPANAWVGIAAGAGVTNQSRFQVAPTFGWFSYWRGSGGGPLPTSLGPNLYLLSGKYTIEVLLSGYKPYIGTVDLTKSGRSPAISLTRDPSTGVYTPLWAFGNSDLANISTNGRSFEVGTVGNQYRIEQATPTVGAPFGVRGSLSWLFSNLNDYLFTVWIGEYLNSTTDYAQSNPAPTFQMDYPSWQLSPLAFFDVPTTNQFQLYFYHVQNFTLAGTSGIYSWVSGFTVPVSSVVCNSCVNDLFAGNSFRVSDQGLQFLSYGPALPAGVSPGAARNVVWGNTFTPDPQPAYAGIMTPSTALLVGESYDRIYDNAFDSHGSSWTATATSPRYDTNWWNVTCQSGYDPLSQASYPGPRVCEPLSYTQTVNGFPLTGSILGSHYQGGNYWAGYGDRLNPYGNIPFKARTPSTTVHGGIATAIPGFAGDYAPLITTTVYRSTFLETGLPPSASPTAFEVRILGPSGTPLRWVNSTATTVTPPGCRPTTVCVKFYLPNGSYEFRVSAVNISGTRYVPSPALGSLTVSGSRVGPTVITFRVAPIRSIPRFEDVPGSVPVSAARTRNVLPVPSSRTEIRISSP